MSIHYRKGVTAIVLSLMLLFPYHSYAETTWQPRTNSELIAFLYGVIAQLQTQLEAIRSGSNSSDDSDDEEYEDTDSDDTTSTSGRPRVTTGDVDDVTANAALVNVEIDMRSYGYGTVFLVYGTSKSKVTSVTREQSYDDIDVDTTIARFIINTSSAGAGEIISGLYGLQASTEYHYRACVEYADDGGRNDDTELACGDVESFTTKRR